MDLFNIDLSFIDELIEQCENYKKACEKIEKLLNN